MKVNKIRAFPLSGAQFGAFILKCQTERQPEVCVALAFSPETAAAQEAESFGCDVLR